MQSDWGISPQDTGSFPDDDMTDAQLIRQWWFVYLHALRTQAWSRLGGLEDLCALTKQTEERGITKPGRPMTRKGAEDLADQVDDWKRQHMA